MVMPSIKYKAIYVAIAVFILVSVVSAVAWLFETDVIAQSPATLVIKSRIDAGPWTAASAIYPLKGQKVTLRISPVPGGKVKWYQIVPDTSKMYKNCNFPWEKGPYKWIGLAKPRLFPKGIGSMARILGN